MPALLTDPGSSLLNTLTRLSLIFGHKHEVEKVFRGQSADGVSITTLTGRVCLTGDRQETVFRDKRSHEI